MYTDAGIKTRCPISPNESPLIVQFLHQTVKSFIQKPGNLNFLSNARSPCLNGIYYIAKYMLALAKRGSRSSDGASKSITVEYVFNLLNIAKFAEAASPASFAEVCKECGDNGIAWLFNSEVWAVP